MAKQDFNPRQAALNHAGMAIDGDLASAIACGLVYVGDQLAVLIEELREGNLSGVANLLEQLDITVNNGLVAIEQKL